MGRRKQRQGTGAVNYAKRGRKVQPQDEEYEPPEIRSGDGDSSESDLGDDFFAAIIQNASKSPY